MYMVKVEQKNRGTFFTLVFAKVFHFRKTFGWTEAERTNKTDDDFWFGWKICSLLNGNFPMNERCLW